jgi:hypothetical protein
VTSEEQPPAGPEPTAGSARDEAPESASGGEADRTLEDGMARMVGVIADQVAEIRLQLERLLSIQVDRALLRLRSGLLSLFSVLIFALLGLVVTVAAALYLLEGMAGAFTLLFQGRSWAGNLAAGGSVLLVALLVIGGMGRWLRRRELRRLKRRYEETVGEEDAE